MSGRPRQGIFAFSWLELVQPDRTTLSVLRLWAVAWFVIMIIGAIVFSQRWIAAADPSRRTRPPSPNCRPGDGSKLSLVNPLAGLSAWTPPPGAVAVVAALLGGRLRQLRQHKLVDPDRSAVCRTVAAGRRPACSMIIIVMTTFSLGGVLDGALYRATSSRLSTADGRSVVPIVVGYAIAHYATLLILEGQRAAINFSDPLAAAGISSAPRRWA